MRAIITGATSGIGFKTAETLGLAGYEIIMTDRTDENKDKALSDLLAKISKNVDCVDLLVNCVGGLGGRQRVSEMETEFMRRVMALNFDSVFFTTRATLPLLKKSKNASIINFSTIAVTSGGGAGASIYSASKYLMYLII